MSCCPPKGYTRLFSKRAARRDAKRYDEKGLDDTAAEMVGFLREHGVEGASVLEIGGGVGAIQLELLEAGAAQATNLELSPEYEETAEELVRERGLEGRVERRLGDVVQEPVPGWRRPMPSSCTGSSAATRTTTRSSAPRRSGRGAISS